VPLKDLMPKGPARLGVYVMAVYFGWLILLIVVILLLAVFGIL
jgi:hypothetical protein